MNRKRSASGTPFEARWQRVVAIVRLSSLRRGVFGFSIISSPSGLAPIFPDTFIALPITGSPPQIFPWRTISQCTVRMPFVVMFEGLRKVLCRC